MRLFGRRKRERELQEEVQAHLAIDIRQRIERGESPEEARANAHRQFGNLALVQEVTRGVWRTRALDRLEHDLRHALRYTWGTFRKEPGFFLLTMLTLALVMGSNTLLFSAYNRLILKNRAGSGHPDRLVDVLSIRPGRGENAYFSYPDYLDHRDGASLIDLAAYFGYDRVGLRVGKNPTQSARLATVSGNYFDVLEIRPVVGRLLKAEDDVPGAAPVTVISHRAWARHFGSATAAVGSPIVLRGQTFTIVGVAPPEFAGTDVDREDAWVPVSMVPEPLYRTERRLEWLRLVGRLRPGVSLKQAQAAASVIASNLAGDPDNRNRSIRLINEWYHGFQGQTLMSLQGLGLVVLLMACANIAAIGLSRAAARHSEIVLRLALGAHRRRILFQLLTETTALFAPAAIAGFFLARTFTTWELFSEYRQIEADLSPDWRVAVFTSGLTLIAGVAAGLTPALQAMRTDLSTTLQERSGGGHKGKLRLQSVLIVGQVAVSIALLTIGGLYFNALRHIAASRSFNPGNVQVVSLDLEMAGIKADDGTDLVRQTRDRLETLPGIDSAALTSDVPQNDEPNWSGTALWKSGQAIVKTRPDLRALSQSVTPGYFSTLRLPLIAGRDFDASNSANAPRVAIISKNLATKLWPAQNAVGQTFYDCDDAQKCKTEVIGVAAEVTPESPSLVVYRPYDQAPESRIYIVFQSVSPGGVIPSIRNLLSEMNPNLPIITIQSLNEIMHSTFFYQYLIVWAAGLMGGTAIFMAALGIYGVSAHAVVSRKKEIGIRTALGARPTAVVRVMIRRGMALAAIGLPLGCAGGFLVAQRIPQLGAYHIIPFEPSVYAMACFGALAVAFLATYLPARRATKADPMEVLRHE